MFVLDTVPVASIFPLFLYACVHLYIYAYLCMCYGVRRMLYVHTLGTKRHTQLLVQFIYTELCFFLSGIVGILTLHVGSFQFVWSQILGMYGVLLYCDPLIIYFFSYCNMRACVHLCARVCMYVRGACM